MLLPYVLFVFLYVGSYLLIYEFESWITGVCSPYVISLNDFAYYVFGQEPAVAKHLALWHVLLVCHQYDVCENSVGSVYVGGYGGLSESGLCVFCKLCPVCFLVVLLLLVSLHHTFVIHCFTHLCAVSLYISRSSVVHACGRSGQFSKCSIVWGSSVQSNVVSSSQYPFTPW